MNVFTVFTQSSNVTFIGFQALGLACEKDAGLYVINFQEITLESFKTTILMINSDGDDNNDTLNSDDDDPIPKPKFPFELELSKIKTINFIGAFQL